MLLILHKEKISLHYNESNNFLFLNVTNIYPFKAKDSEIKDYAQCLGNISKDFIINNMKRKKTGLKETEHFFLFFLIQFILMTF